MVFRVFHDGDVSGRKEFTMAEKNQKPVISAKEEVLDGLCTVSKLKAFWRQSGAVLSGKKEPELLQAVSEDFDILGRTSVTMLRVGFVTSFHPSLFSALLYKYNPDAVRTKSSTGPATGGEAASVSALTPPLRHLVCRPIRRRTLLSIAPFILQFMLECGTKSGDEVTLVQRPMDRGHKICFTMTIYPAVSTVDGEAFINSHCHASQHKNTKCIQKLVFCDRRLAFASCECVACTEGGLCPQVFAALKVLNEG